MSFLDSYRNRMNVLGLTKKDRFTNLGRRNYNIYLENAPTTNIAQITDVGEPYVSEKTKKVKCTIKQLVYNDEKNLDQKILTTPCDTNVGVGCYVLWEDITYLVIFQQKLSIDTHKSFVIRPCNGSYSCYYDKDKKMIDIYLSVQKLTINSDGVDVNNFLGYESDKRKALVSNNDFVTANLSLGTKFKVGKYATFKVVSIDDYTMKGLCSIIIQETLEKDNQGEKTPTINQKPVDKSKIVGNATIKTGMSATYSMTYPTKVGWKLNGENVNRLKIVRLSDSSCKITATNDSRLIGDKFELQALDGDNLLDKKEIEIVSII